MKRTIALVEDNPDNRLLVQAILDDVYDIVEFETGVAALDGFATFIPDLVLLDLSLPEMDGTEVLRRMRLDPRLVAVPVIALTAHAMSGDRERFLADGFDDYLTKPIVDDTLQIGAIERGLAER
jgi:CheY-like chemotaxis protein